MKKYIMTVEDSTSLREMISFTLDEAGYEVLQAEDGQDALSKMNDYKIDMVITDLNMPKMNGIELTRSLRSKNEYRFMPILFLTTESQRQKQQAARDAGATGWIVKPFKPEKLLKVVHRVLG